jgi:uncharacterized membrane protein YdfJ with MMPL/SSD domain
VPAQSTSRNGSHGHPILGRLDAFIRQRHRAVLLFWLVVAIAAAPFAAHQSDHLIPGGAAAAGSQSAHAEVQLRRDFRQVADTSIAVLLSPRLHATASALRAEISRVSQALRGVPHVTLTPQARESALFSTDLVGPILLPLQVQGSESQAQTIDKRLRARLKIGHSTGDHVEVHLIGEGALWTGLQETFKRDLTAAELVGFPVLLGVLLLIFGSLAAALLPVLLGVGAVIVTGLLIYAVSLTMHLSIFVTNTASLIGVGVAVDYSLIILTRVRQELAAGRSLSEAQSVALFTSGRTVIFSGVTVAASLCGLWLIPDGTLRSMTVGAVLAVTVSVAMAVTLLPALIWTFGARRISATVFTGRLSNGRRLAGPKWRRWTWESWTRALTRRPIVPALIAGTLLLLLCVPAFSMHTSTGALRQLGSANETRLGFDEAASIKGPGALGPIYVVATATRHQAPGQLEGNVEHLRQQAERLPYVKESGLLHITAAGQVAMFTVVPTVDPEAPAAKDLVQKLRHLLAANGAGMGVTSVVGGTSAIQLDQEHQIATNMWKVGVAVLCLAFVVLTILLRSLVLPLKAVVMNVLAVGAAYGVLVAIFQWGWSDSLFHFHSLGHLETLTPPLVLAIVFGLSMDYEIFLLSRIREQWELSGSAEGAVAAGLAASARTISSAALILVCVFAVFVGTGVASIKEIGLGGAVAIGLDATLVRLVLVPALMTMLGRWNWWLPAPLERILPSNMILEREPLPAPTGTLPAADVSESGESGSTGRLSRVGEGATQ